MRWTVMLMLIGFGSSLHGAEPASPVAVRSYSDVGATINQQKGKVVLVYCWAHYCAPCQKKFPGFVALHERYKAKGLAAISLALDDADPDSVALVDEFLIKQHATMINRMMIEKYEFWRPKMHLDGPPCVFLFDRESRLIRRWDGDQVNFSMIEGRVSELLTP